MSYTTLNCTLLCCLWRALRELVLPGNRNATVVVASVVVVLLLVLLLMVLVVLLQ